LAIGNRNEFVHNSQNDTAIKNLEALAMVSQCANPECKRELHYLREGMIYLFALSTSTGTKRVEHFWLCGRCSRSMVLMCRNDADIQITPRPQRHQGRISGSLRKR
jgi:hypothetical protein